jgi:hypothetical protein
MKFPLKVIATGIFTTFLGCSAASASQSEAGPLAAEQLGTNIRIGTVVSVNPAHMVITCRHKGKINQLELVLNGVTVQKGEIAVGSQVTVHYRTQDNRNFATSIQLRRGPSPR